MQVKIWIRSTGDSPHQMDIRTDAKLESRDTPTIQRFGRALIAAIQRGANGETVEVEGKP